MTTAGDQAEPSPPEPAALSGLFGRPLSGQLTLDLVAVALSAAAYLGLANRDVLLHALWIVLVVDAFLFGLRPTSIRIAVASVLLVGFAAGRPSPSSPTTVIAAWPLMISAAIVVAVMADRASSMSRRYASLYREASARLLTAQEDERRRLARELHDGIGQTLTALGLTLGAVDTMLAEKAGRVTPEVAASLGRAQGLVVSAVQEARDVALRVRPAPLRETGLLPALSELAQRAGMAVDVDIAPGLLRPGLLPTQTEFEAFRIVQEALSNSVRHAAARRRWIRAFPAAGAIRIEIGDDGAGFDVDRPPPQGLGLASMADRASLIGARFHVASQPGRGTIVAIDIPTPASAGAVETLPTPSRP